MVYLYFYFIPEINALWVEMLYTKRDQSIIYDARLYIKLPISMCSKNHLAPPTIKHIK